MERSPGTDTGFGFGRRFSPDFWVLLGRSPSFSRGDALALGDCVKLSGDLFTRRWLYTSVIRVHGRIIERQKTKPIALHFKMPCLGVCHFRVVIQVSFGTPCSSPLAA